MAAIIAIQGVTKVFSIASQAVTALNGVDLSIEAAQRVAITGRSGSGKSTLLHLIGLLDAPTEGKIIIKQVDTSSLADRMASKFRNQAVGFIFQMNNLLPDFSALENVIMPYLIAGGQRQKIIPKAMDLLRSVGMENRINHRPGEMSGGEQQRVAIARALVMSPPIVLADEPTGNLDKTNSDKVMNVLHALCEDHQVTLLLVTHDPAIAESMPSSIVMEDGRIVARKGQWS